MREKSDAALEAAMRKKEHFLIDREELEHYHRMLEKTAERKGQPILIMETKRLNRKELCRLLLCDRSDVEKYRDMGMSKDVAAYYDDRRAAVDKLTRQELAERHEKRKLAAKYREKGGGVGIG